MWKQKILLVPRLLADLILFSLYVSFSHQLKLAVFHWSDMKSTQMSRTFLGILGNPSKDITTGITVAFMFHGFQLSVKMEVFLLISTMLQSGWSLFFIWYLVPHLRLFSWFLGTLPRFSTTYSISIDFMFNSFLNSVKIVEFFFFLTMLQSRWFFSSSDRYSSPYLFSRFLGTLPRFSPTNSITIDFTFDSFLNFVKIVEFLFILTMLQSGWFFFLPLISIPPAFFLGSWKPFQGFQLQIVSLSTSRSIDL